MPNRTVSADSNDYRVVIFGSAEVGKTSLLKSFTQGTFKDQYTPTIEDTYRQVGTGCGYQFLDYVIIEHYM